MHPNLMNFTQYAAHRGVARYAVKAALDSGRISSVLDEQGKKRIDPVQADLQWMKNTDPAKQNSMKQKEELKLQNDPHPDLIPPMHESRARRAWFEAKLSELEYQEKAKEVLPAKQVRKECFELGRRVRDAILQIPDRMASQLAAERDSFRIHKLLSQELTTALRGLSDLEKI